MELGNFLHSNKIFYENNVRLSTKTWVKTGGTCKYWIIPISVQQLSVLCAYLIDSKISFDIIGNTSNIFFHSTYNPKVVVSTVKMNNYQIDGDILTCESGVNVMKLAKEMVAKGYAGFYGLVGLPGTVGAAAVNNAGCFGCSISSMLISAEVLLPDATVKTYLKEDFGYEKRSSAFKRGETKGVILTVKLKLQRAVNVEEEFRKSEETKLYRKKNQEGPAKNLGSIFSQMTLRYNYRNRIAANMANMLGRFKLSDKKRAYKWFILWFYGYRDLYPYISDKLLNTFIWRDEYAEKKFVRYKELMGKVYDNLEQEIEERK